MEFHPIANIFPMMSDDELSELAKSIASNGLTVPILLHEGKILDGRNRYQACESSGVKPEYTEYGGNDPLSHVLDLNLHRRHLTSGQKAVVVAEAQTVGSGRFKNRNIAVLPTQEGLAKALNVSPTYVREVKGIKRASPDRYEQVKSGELTIQQAKREMKEEKLEKLQPNVSPLVLHSRKKFKSVTNHILKAKLESDEWKHADDTVLLRALCREHDTIKRAYKDTIWIQRNLESLSKDLKAEIKRRIEDGADFGADGSHHIIQLDDVHLESEENTLEAQIMEPTESDQDGQQTIVGLLDERHVQDGQDENV